MSRVIYMLLVIFEFAENKERIWRFDADVANPDNWIGGRLATNCKGLYFAPVNSAPVFIAQLTTPELTLPIDGEVDIIDGGFIEFKDNKKCIKLKSLNYHDWYDPSSWSQTDSNVAVPDMERIPCTGDDVIFPKIYHSRVLESYGLDVSVGSVKLGDGRERLENVLQSKLGRQIFRNPYGDVPAFVTSKRKCDDPYGCLCHNDYISCPMTPMEEGKLNCLNPVIPEEFCREICGAYITYKSGNGPTIDDLRSKLEEYTVDTHASRVKDYLNNEVIQIVFSEKQYTGKSLEEAEALLRYLKSSHAENLQLVKSSEFYTKEESSSTVAIALGTLAVVVAFFGVLFFINGDNPLLRIINRLNANRGSAFVSSSFFARFDNTDENLIIDSQSEAGSILDLPKSFDNPLYDQSNQSCSTTSTQHENPLYDVKEDEDIKTEE